MSGLRIPTDQEAEKWFIPLGLVVTVKRRVASSTKANLYSEGTE